METPSRSPEFVSEEAIQEVVGEVLPHFEFNLHSASTVSEMLPTVIERCDDAGLPRRRSLHLLIMKLAKVAWQGRILEAQEANRRKFGE